MNFACYETKYILKQSNYSALMSPSTRVARTAHLGGTQEKKSSEGARQSALGSISAVAMFSMSTGSEVQLVQPVAPVVQPPVQVEQPDL